MYWYCWIIFCIVATVTIHAYPGNDNVQQKTLLALNAENDDENSVAKALLTKQIKDDDIIDEESDEDESEDIIDTSEADSITSRHLGSHKKRFKREKLVCYRRVHRKDKQRPHSSNNRPAASSASGDQVNHTFSK